MENILSYIVKVFPEILCCGFRCLNDVFSKTVILRGSHFRSLSNNIVNRTHAVNIFYKVGNYYRYNLKKQTSTHKKILYAWLLPSKIKWTDTLCHNKNKLG